MPDKIKLKIEEWELLLQIKILDPDGFDRSNPNLYNEEFIFEEFEKGAAASTQIGFKDHEEWAAQYLRMASACLGHEASEDFCEPCIHLSLTELQQKRQGERELHYCEQFSQRVFHHQHHPNLIRLDECIATKSKKSF